LEGRGIIRTSNPASRWARVKGPMSFFIATLFDVGWDPISPHRWKPPQGDKYIDLDDALCNKLLISEVFTESIMLALWLEASSRSDAKGLEQCPDATVLRKEVNKAIRKGQNHIAGIITNIAAGGQWTEERLSLRCPDVAVSNICRRCNIHVETLIHRYYQCPANATYTCPEIEQTQHLCKRATERWNAETCFWSRGLVPLDWNKCKPKPEYMKVYQSPTLHAGEIDVGSDGSGGSYIKRQTPQTRWL
jgi:hypothetical protein